MYIFIVQEYIFGQNSVTFDQCLCASVYMCIAVKCIHMEYVSPLFSFVP